MPRAQQAHAVSPGQAQYVLDRLLSERRVSAEDVQRYLADLPREIAEIEARLRTLRSMTEAHDGDASTAAKASAKTSKIVRRRKHSAEGRLGLRFSGLIRHLPDRVRAAMKQLRLERGVEAAIAAAQAVTK
jgi:hypothetical protein